MLCKGRTDNRELQILWWSLGVQFLSFIAFILVSGFSLVVDGARSRKLPHPCRGHPCYRALPGRFLLPSSSPRRCLGEADGGSGSGNYRSASGT